MWISVRDKDVILPSRRSCILVTDGKNTSVISVDKFLDYVDSKFSPWKYWMPIPKIPES